MKTELFIGSSLADFNESVNVRFGVGDIRDLSIGNNNKSYTIEIPLTPNNRALISFSDILGSKSEISEEGRLIINDGEIIRGKIRLQSIEDLKANILIESDDWIDELKGRSLRDINLSTHTFTKTNVANSWSGDDKLYRYPLINFGRLWGQETGSSANWFPNDFLAWWRLKNIVDGIFSEYTIQSDFLDSAYFKSILISGKEPIKPSEYLEEKAFETAPVANTTNEDTYNYSASENYTLTFSDTVINNNETSDEGNNHNTSTGVYTIPETGTYYFEAKVYINLISGGLFTKHSGSISMIIYKNGSTVIDQTSDSWGLAVDPTGKNYTLNTGWMHFEEGDEITVYVSMSENLTYNGTGTAYANLQLNKDNTYFKNIVDERCLYTGLNKTVDPEEYLPDIDQYEFLIALKHAFNLKFSYDRFKRTIRIEPFDSFVTDNVKDITNDLDLTEGIKTEILSRSYKRTLTYQWKDDETDRAVNDYILENGIPLTKAIILESEYAIEGNDKKENPQFAPLVTGVMLNIGLTTAIPRIYGTETIEAEGYPYYRGKEFTPKLATWEGLTSGFTWYYMEKPDESPETKTTYPKISPIDYSDLYSNYYIRTFHWIDKGKILIVNKLIRGGELSEFITVKGNSEEEGFRTLYKATIDGMNYLLILNNIVTDGNIAECEFIIKS